MIGKPPSIPQLPRCDRHVAEVPILQEHSIGRFPKPDRLPDATDFQENTGP